MCKISPAHASARVESPTPVVSPRLGVIRSDELYTLEEFKRRTGLHDAALRAARRAGFRVDYRHGKGFVLGAEWIRYVTATTA